MKVLITCPPMLRMLTEFLPIFDKVGMEVVAPNVVQTLTEEELIEILPGVDAWIIGDDPATYRVFKAGKQGKLKAAVKWGVGVDNVDFNACKELEIPIINTPQMFGAEVATVAVAYVLGLARQTYYIDKEVKEGNWVKPAGMSLAGKTVALVGFGDIGKASAKFLKAFDMKINIYDPFASKEKSDEENYNFLNFPDELHNADFVLVTCALTPATKHLINAETIQLMKEGVRIVNVSRGPIVDEKALVEGLKSNKIHSVGLEVFETEPLPADSELRNFSDRCIFGTHNGSNTVEGVRRASHQAINSLFGFLNINYSL